MQCLTRSVARRSFTSVTNTSLHVQRVIIASFRSLADSQFPKVILELSNQLVATVMSSEESFLQQLVGRLLEGEPIVPPPNSASSKQSAVIGRALQTASVQWLPLDIVFMLALTASVSILVQLSVCKCLATFVTFWRMQHALVFARSSPEGSSPLATGLVVQRLQASKANHQAATPHIQPPGWLQVSTFCCEKCYNVFFIATVVRVVIANDF